jgi:hypothetical protein
VDGIPTWGFVLALVVGVYIVGVTWFARTEASTTNQRSLIGAAHITYRIKKIGAWPDSNGTRHALVCVRRRDDPC